VTRAAHPDEIVDLFVYQDQLMLRYAHGGYRRVTGDEMDVLLRALKAYSLDKRMAS
jgi:hypothetical protein